MNNLVLIRHGEVEYPTNDDGQRLIYGPKVELSREGYRQADALTKTLRDENITPDNVYSSPYIRAFFTAVPIANEFDKGLYTDEDLIDVYAPGWEGRTMDELKEVGGDIYAAPPMSDDQETPPTLVERAHNVLQKITEDKEGQTIVVVSHGDLLSAMNWVLMREGKPASYPEMVKNKYMDKGQAILYELNHGLSIEGEGRMIITEESKMTAEGFRGNPERR